MAFRIGVLVALCLTIGTVPIAPASAHDDGVRMPHVADGDAPDGADAVVVECSASFSGAGNCQRSFFYNHPGGGATFTPHAAFHNPVTLLGSAKVEWFDAQGILVFTMTCAGATWSAEIPVGSCPWWVSPTYNPGTQRLVVTGSAASCAPTTCTVHGRLNLP